jgi:hypothetical protein
MKILNKKLKLKFILAIIIFVIFTLLKISADANRRFYPIEDEEDLIISDEDYNDNINIKQINLLTKKENQNQDQGQGQTIILANPTLNQKEELNEVINSVEFKKHSSKGKKSKHSSHSKNTTQTTNNNSTTKSTNVKTDVLSDMGENYSNGQKSIPVPQVNRVELHQFEKVNKNTTTNIGPYYIAKSNLSSKHPPRSHLLSFMIIFFIIALFTLAMIYFQILHNKRKEQVLNSEIELLNTYYLIRE